MPRQLRIQYPGALYHAAARGDRREDIVRFGDEERDECLSADQALEAADFEGDPAMAVKNRCLTLSCLTLSCAGVVGDNLEIRYQFGEFSRLQIGTKWYRISDRKPWRFLAKYRKASEQADGMDHNGDGDQQDEIWIDAGTTSDATNGGF